MIYYNKNILMCEDIKISDLVKIYKTPFYVYSKNDILEKIRHLKNIFSEIKDCSIVYAIKAENNLSILKLMIEEEIGGDVDIYWRDFKIYKSWRKSGEYSFFGRS